jgi:hypothetical protein
LGSVVVVVVDDVVVVDVVDDVVVLVVGVVDDVVVDVEVDEVVDDVVELVVLDVLDVLVVVVVSHGTGAVVVVVSLHSGRVSEPNSSAPTARSPRMSPTAITQSSPAATCAAVGGHGKLAASVASTPDVVQPGMVVVVVVGDPLLL